MADCNFDGRLTELERAARFGVYARFYGPMAVAVLALSFMPLFNDVVDGNFTVTYGTLWQMAAEDAGGPAVFGILLLLALVVFLAIATFGVRMPGLPIAVAADAALIVLMLLGKPGTGDPEPGLAGAGQAGLVIALCTVGVAVAHAVHLHVHRRNG